MRRMRRLQLGLAFALAMTAAACGTVRPANVGGQCRQFGNEIGLARSAQQVDEAFEAGVAAGCWQRPGHG